MHNILLWVPGWGELLIIMLFILIFFGAKKIPEIAKGMGKGIREFKDATKEIKEEIKEGAGENTKS
ncbi:MAG: twin-arginine translocase TatA/TatE family subunit [Bacteroidota bacterium]